MIYQKEFERFISEKKAGEEKSIRKRNENLELKKKIPETENQPKKGMNNFCYK